MLRFLSRDASNAQRIADLKRKADASALTSKAKRVLSDTKLNAETKSAPVAVLAPAVPIYNPLTSEEAENVVLSFIKTEFYTQFSSMEQTQSIVLPSGIVAVMEQLRRDIEIKFGEKQSASKIKFLGRTKKPFLTWKQRADIVYFLLHPGFTKGDAQLAADVFGIPKSTIRTWVNDKTLFSRWLPFVKDLHPLKVQQIIPSSTGQVWKEIPAETLASLGCVDWSKFFPATPQPQQQIVKFTQLSSHAYGESYMSKQKKVALAQKHKDKTRSGQELVLNSGQN